VGILHGAGKLCGHAGCPNLTPCPDHQRKPWEGSTRSKQLPADWTRRRRYVLERDPICTTCDNALSTEVHHRGRQDDHSYENLCGICTDCHKIKTQQEAQDAKAKEREG
jgi:5-methylcytosine-specific restriction endonuclease McrA